MKNVAYVVRKSLIESVDKIVSVKKRASLVHSLIASFGLLNKVNLVSFDEASESDLRMFHSEEYIDYLQNVGSNKEWSIKEEEDFGLGFDCPNIDGIYGIVSEIAGASLRAADVLLNEEAKYAINWAGGWHHSQRDSASGFCYVNDVVLAIQRLRTKFDKVLYVDLDVHHGDGVENAFSFSPKIFTLSLHQHEPGFFPGSGAQCEVGYGKGKHTTLNVPYKVGITDHQLQFLLQRSLNGITRYFMPDVVVCQCGADTLAGDPLGGANVSLDGYLECVKRVLDLDKPTLFLGGGGYKPTNAAKLWTGITMLLLERPIPEEIPEHPFFPLYGPDFSFEVNSNLRRSENTQDFLDQIIRDVESNLQNLRTESEENTE